MLLIISISDVKLFLKNTVINLITSSHIQIIMINKIIRYCLYCIFGLFNTFLSAQTVYLAEVGFNGGGSYLIDDMNEIPFINPKIDFGVTYRHNFNQRFSAHAEWNSSNFDYDPTGIKKNTEVNMIDFCGEFNFFDLIKRDYKPKSKSFSPYIFTGYGVALTENTIKSFPFGVGYIPFGIGFKYKMGNRINLNGKWAHRILLNDNIEGITGPLNGTNLLNNDLLSTYTIGISYDFWERPCDCKNSYKLSNKKK